MPARPTPRPKTAPAPKKPVAPKAKATPAQMALNFSLYPDLAPAITTLQKRQAQLAANDNQAAELVTNWLKELTRIQSQITKLKRLEGLTSAARRPIP